MFTDIVGYTSLTQKDESSTLQLLENHRRLLRPIFNSHGGREIKTTGDGFLIEFQSALNAVLCAAAVQQTMHDRKVATGEQVSIRIGIHIGDVVESGNDILGDAVNVASRIEPLAEPGGVCISDEVYKQVKTKSDLRFVSLGEKFLKNVAVPVAVYKVVMPWEQSTTAEVPAYEINRVAILPFRSMSPDPNDEYFAEGMTEEIISTVSGISGLKVISRTSVMGYKGTTKKVEEIGRELKVGSVLEGSFRKAGNRIRVTTQLIKVADDEHLWAQNYDRNLDDVFEVQTDVAKQVAEALRVKILTPEKERIEKKPTESAAAYTFYLKGRSLWNKRGSENVKKAMEHFELAVKEDPGFALGFAGQADCAVMLAGEEQFDLREGLTKAKDMAERALQLDPALAEAHTTLGLVNFYEFNPRMAEEEFKRAIELKPSYATAHQWYALVLRSKLRWDEALREAEKAVELDPLSGIIILNLGFYYSDRRDFAKAAEKYRIALELGLESLAHGNVSWVDSLAHANLFWAYGMMKMYDQMEKEAEVVAKQLQGAYPNIGIFIDASKAYTRGDKETVRRLLPELEAHPKDMGATPCNVADFYFYLGDVDKGFEWLERAYSERNSSLMSIQSDWDLDGVRNDPRYLDLLKRLGLKQPL
jgi:TolB-like protein/tetratricopeptide (TPR) repeat protein